MAVARQTYSGKDSKLVVVAANTMGLTSVGLSGVTYAPCNVIGSGVDYNARIGRRIRVKRIAFMGVLLGGQTNSVADDPYNVMRVIVWTARPDYAPTLAVNAVLDPRFPTNLGLYRVLYDKQRVIGTQAKDSTGYIPAAEEWEFSIDCDIPLEYTVSTAASPTNQNIFVSVVSDSAAVVNPGFAANSALLLEYIDDA